MWSSSTSTPDRATWTSRRRCRLASTRGSSATRPAAVRGLAGALEEGLHLDRQAHVAFDLELALHEGGGAVELPGHDLDPVAGIGQQREIGRVSRLALPGFGLTVVDLDPPLAAVVSAEVELDGCLGGAGLLRQKVLGQVLDDLVGCQLGFRHQLLLSNRKSDLRFILATHLIGREFPPWPPGWR